MNKKLAAIAIAVLMLVGLFPVLSIPPVAAQDSVCDNAPMCVFLHPGVEDTYKPGFSQTLGTLWGLNGGEAQKAQVFDKYLDYAILASASADNPSSIGDLQFDVEVTEEISAIQLWIPPEFKFTAATKEESVWTDMTNDYQYLLIVTASAYDPIAPGWTIVTIGIEQWWGSGPTPASQIGAVIAPGTYHIRLFSVAAPATAGLYHFKIYYYTGELNSDPNNPLYWDNYFSLGAENFPIMIVKSELNPAWVEVTVRTELYFATPFVSGKVVAAGTTPEGRNVEAWAFWGPNEFIGNVFTPDLYGNGGAEYSLVLFGLAEGTYDLTAYASGAVPRKSERITVLAGQSYHYYMTVYDSPDIFATIYSKHGSGETPWHNIWQLPFGTNDPYAEPCDDETDQCPRRDILVELYDSDNKMVGFWGSNDAVAGTHEQGGPYYSSASARKWFGWTNRFGWTGTFDADGHPVFGSSPLVPTATSVSLHLVDNYDLLFNPRGVPGTEWDGHVPWDTADYVNGILGGTYTLEAFVTGYIMDESDAYQRTFTATGIDEGVVFDLRRTNWIEVQMHMSSGDPLSADTTVTLTAEDADGNERAAAAFYAPAGTTDVVCAPVGICGVVLEGKNAIFPNIGSSVFRGTGRARQPSEKDYGLNPTASTHSAGAVALAGNPYTVKLYMADMGIPWEGIEGTGWYNIVGAAPQASVFLCNSAATISFTIRPAYLELFLRSVDFQVPAHERPWTFPGSEIWVEFKDEAGETADYLDPTCYGLIQDAGQLAGPPWEITGAASGFNEDGVEVGWGVSPYDVDNAHEAGHHSRLAVRYAGTDWTSPAAWCSVALYRALPAGGFRSTSLPAGQYMMDVHTHGYVMRRSFPVSVPAVGGADIAADLIQGAQLRVIASFKHEQIKTLFSGFVRMEVLNENDELVGASIYGRAEPNMFTDNKDGGGYFGVDDPYFYFYDTLYAGNMKVPDPAQAAGFGWPSDWYPSTATDRPGPWGAGDGLAGSSAQRAMFSNLFYGIPDCPDELDTTQCQVWASWDYTTPIDANKFVGTGFSGGEGTDTIIMDVFGFYWYAGDPARTWAGGWPTTNGLSNSGPQVGGSTGFAWDSGLRGSNDIPNWDGSGGGKYKVKLYAFDYERKRMYAMGWPLENIELTWGGAKDLYVDLNSLATLRGDVNWLDMYGNYRGLPWAQISASPGPDDGTPAYATPVTVGCVAGWEADPGPCANFFMWLPAGTHDVSVSTSEASGVWGAPEQYNADYTVSVTDGWVGGGDSRLSAEPGVPVPELPAYFAPFALFAALAASVWLLRKRNLNTPLLMK